MRTCWVFLHIFAVLLLCDHGMFSTPSPFPSERTTIQTSNTSHSNTTVTTGETRAVVDDEEDEDEEMSTGDTEPPIDWINETTSNPATEFKGWDRNETKVIHSTARPKSTTTTTIAIGMKKNDESKTDAGSSSGSITGGIIILVIIIILIVLLLSVLYFLRKKGRSYSFDLTRVDGPANDYDTPLNQQGISYELTNKDLSVCLDCEPEDKSEEKSSPTANGCAGDKPDPTPVDTNDEQNVPEENSFSSSFSSTPPMKKVEFSLDLDLIGGESDLNDLSAADSTDEPHNQNNNNLSNAGRGAADEMFTEISLDEPKHQA